MTKFDEKEAKSQLKQALARLGIKKEKKVNSVINTKREITDLLRTGKDEQGRVKVETVIRDDYLSEAYDLLKMYVDLLMGKLSSVATSKTPPPDMAECLATVIWAAPRIDVKELTVVRDMLVSKFGKDTCKHLIESAVNPKVQFKLSIETPDQTTVYQYMSEIARNAGLEWKADPPASMQLSQPGSSAASLKSAFPEPPTSAVSSMPSFPTPPSSNVTPSIPSMPDIPIPSFNASQMPGVPTPNFGGPSTPTGGVPVFPSIPSSKPASSPAPVFPSIPTNTTTTTTSSSAAPVFPSTPDTKPATNSEDPPDFDDLAARFEKLKKK